MPTLTSVTQASIDGNLYPVQYEYTSGAVKNAYLQNLQPLIDVLNLNSPSAVTSANLAAVKAGIANLAALAANGIDVPDPSDPTKTVKSYMNVDMAQNLDLVLKSLKTVGISDYANMSLLQLQQWRDLATQSPEIFAILESAQSSGLVSTRTLQSFVEIQYVKEGNEMIGDNLSSLEQALSTSKKALDTLTQLQNIHNMLTVNNRSAFPFDYANNDSPENYQSAASAYFGKPLTPVLLNNISSPTASGYLQTIQSLVRLRDSLLSEIAYLSSITPADAQASPDTLLSRLRVVYNDLKTNLVAGNPPQQISLATDVTSSFSGFKKWMLDNYSSFTSTTGNLSGSYQQNITLAVTSAQAFNDDQKEKVRRYLFVFEEFYKSAAAVLTKITQMIEKMAQNIAR